VAVVEIISKANAKTSIKTLNASQYGLAEIWIEANLVK
jgi:hypothetical protein